MSRERNIVKCEVCRFELWSDDKDEIEQWKYLVSKDDLKCSICEGKMRFVNETGGRHLISMDSFSELPPAASSFREEMTCPGV